MTRRGKIAGVLTLLAALLIGSPAPAGESYGESKDLRQQVADLREELAQLRRSYDRDSRLVNAELKLVDARLARIERALDRMTAGRVESTSRFEREGVVGTGTIRLDNRLGVTAWVTIDGVRYSVPPFRSRLLRDRPAGTVTYSVTANGFGVRPTVRTPLSANETLTLTVREPDFE